MPKLAKVALLCALLAVAADVGVSVFVIRDGALGYRALPPFAGTHHPRQKEWLAQQQAYAMHGAPAWLTGAFDRELGWTNRASSGTGVRADTPYNYNALGARSQREHTAEPAPGVLRVACFGESFTHGDEVGDLDTWPVQLEQLDARIEALNFGVGGYGPDQALLRMRREGLHGARVALMGYMVENIGRSVNRYRPLWHTRTNACGAKPRFRLVGERLELVPIPYATSAELLAAIADDSIVRDLAEHEYWGAETRMTYLHFSSFARIAAGRWADRRREAHRLYADLEAEPAATTLAILEAFSREARAAGAERAVVLVYARSDELHAGEVLRSPVWGPFLQRLRERGVEVLDTSIAFAHAFEAAGEQAQQRLFSGGHYSREGNAVIAREVRAWLAREFESAALDQR